MGYDLTNVFVFFLFAVMFVVVTVSVLSWLLRPSAHPADEPAKEETYECGEPAIGSSWVRFDIRFYTVALIFIIFDVEVAFLYPWGVIFKDFRAGGQGLFVFLEMLLFIAILAVGFIYCWRKGDLDWVKSSEGQRRRGVEVAARGQGGAGGAPLVHTSRERELAGAGRGGVLPSRPPRGGGESEAAR